LALSILLLVYFFFSKYEIFSPNSSEDIPSASSPASLKDKPSASSLASLKDKPTVSLPSPSSHSVPSPQPTNVKGMEDLYNIAYGKKATSRQQSVEVVVDGFISGNRKSQTCFFLDKNEVIELDFQGKGDIAEIDIYEEGSNFDQVSRTLEVEIIKSGGESEKRTFESKTSVFGASELDIGEAAYLKLSSPNEGICIAEIEVYSPQKGQEAFTDSSGIHLFVSYYSELRKDRKSELEKVMRRNLRNPYFSKIHLLAQNCSSIEWNHPKISVTCFDQQPLYSDFFRLAFAEKSAASSIIANGDIIFKNSIHLVSRVINNSSYLILPRWAIQCGKTAPIEKNKCHNSRDTFDAFVINPKGLKPDWDLLNIPMNRGFAEHIAAYILNQGGLKPLNPCMDIPIFHLHCTRYRSWKSAPSIKANWRHVHKVKAPAFSIRNS